jgi:hypothetical protein
MQRNVENFESENPEAYNYLKTQSAGFVHKFTAVKRLGLLNHEALEDVEEDLIKAVFKFKRKKVHLTS